MEIRTTNTAVRDLDIDVVFGPWLWLIFFPDHVSVDGVLVETHPSLELVWYGHIVCSWCCWGSL